VMYSVNYMKLWICVAENDTERRWKREHVQNDTPP